MFPVYKHEEVPQCPANEGDNWGLFANRPPNFICKMAQDNDDDVSAGGRAGDAALGGGGARHLGVRGRSRRHAMFAEGMHPTILHHF